MKTTQLITLLLLAAAPLTLASDSKRTAEYIMVNSAEFEGKEVSLDVSFVKPVKWKSPIADLAFFHVITVDRRDDKAGGSILVAVKAADSGAFAKKYGMDFDGRKDSDLLKGVFLAVPRRDGKKAQIWLVDTTGTAVNLIKEKKLELADDGPEKDKGQGERPFKGKGGKVE